VLLPVRGQAPDWDHFCVGQADRVLLVTLGEELAEQDFTGLPLWAELTANPFRPIELTVIQEPTRSHPQDTGLFLRRHGLQSCHQVRRERPADFARVARMVTGQAIGLVLGGGGARGFAHVGVIQALEEQGIPIDHLSGTSMGAYVAAEYAMGLSPAEMNAINREVFIQTNPTNDYTLPLVSLLAGAKCNRNLQRVFGERCIEDLWRPFFCVSASLTQAAIYIHEADRVWEAVRASISIPGVFPPVLREGQVLVDGGILNNLPVNLARKRRGGRIIAVEVSGRSRIQAPVEIGRASCRERVS
jgi:predicted acylesterase/phospholipase RssA